jgi:hypothetical protein
MQIYNILTQICLLKVQQSTFKFNLPSLHVNLNNLLNGNDIISYYIPSERYKYRYFISLHTFHNSFIFIIFTFIKIKKKSKFLKLPSP